VQHRRQRIAVCDHHDVVVERADDGGGVGGGKAEDGEMQRLRVNKRAERVALLEAPLGREPAARQWVGARDPRIVVQSAPIHASCSVA